MTPVVDTGTDRPAAPSPLTREAGTARGRTNPRLVVVPALSVLKLPGSRFQLTKKFVSGMVEYARAWDGEVVVVAASSAHRDDNLDHVSVAASDVPFGIRVADGELVGEVMRATREAASVVLGYLDHLQASLAAAGRAAGVPVVYSTEQSLLTRLQIIRAECPNLLRRYKRQLRDLWRERGFKASVRDAAGLQCNGTPTFEAYQPLNPNSLLFFDTRVSSDMLARDADLEPKSAEVLSGRPLRLAFSGRLLRIKGVNDLPVIAAELRQRRVPFTMEIFGGGECEAGLRDAIVRLDLANELRLRGVVDFATELMPHVSRNVDLFVCCHRQGDPSCTYLETLSCGTPIAGYANEAFAGLLRHGGTGWSVPMSDTTAMADLIEKVAHDRQSLAKAIYASRDFAAKHTFEQTFRRRIDHMRQCWESHGRSTEQ